jgi:hypothetical protein
MSSPPGHLAPQRLRRQGEAAAEFQWSRPKPGCSGITPSRDAGSAGPDILEARDKTYNEGPR